MNKELTKDDINHFIQIGDKMYCRWNMEKQVAIQQLKGEDTILFEGFEYPLEKFIELIK